MDGAEDLGYFAVECGEVKIDDAAAGVEDDVDGSLEQVDVAADGLAHAPLDAVTIDGLPHDFAYGEAYARGIGFSGECGARSDEEGHLARELFAARLIDALVVGVFAETEGERHEDLRDVIDFRAPVRG